MAVYEFHPLMMWNVVEEQTGGARSCDIVSSIQIGDGPTVYSRDWSSMAADSELTVLMVNAEQTGRPEWLSVDGLVVTTAVSDEGISLLSAMAGQGTHPEGTQEWMRPSFMSTLDNLKKADKDIQIMAMVCEAKYAKLGREQGVGRLVADHGRDVRCGHSFRGR